MLQSLLIPQKNLLKVMVQIAAFEEHFPYPEIDLLYCFQCHYWEILGKKWERFFYFLVGTCCSPEHLWVLYFTAEVSKSVEQTDNQSKRFGLQCRALLQAETQTSGKTKDEHTVFTLFCTSCYGRLVIGSC